MLQPCFVFDLVLVTGDWHRITFVRNICLYFPVLVLLQYNR